MPHLLTFNRSYWPDLGATGQLLAELCEDLVAHHGWEVTVMAGPPTVTLESVRNGVPHAGRNGTRYAGVNGLAHLGSNGLGHALGNGHNGVGHVTGNGAAHPAANNAGPHGGRGDLVRGVRVVRAFGTRFDKAAFAGRAANYVSYFGSAALSAARVRRPDVVMSLTDPPILGLAALAWARRWRAPFVYVCQDVFPEVALLLEDFQSGTVTRLLDRVSRTLLRRADAVVALGETMARKLAAKGADSRAINVIHNWADRALIHPTHHQNTYSEAHDLTGRFVVLHSGNIGLGQGLETLVDAAALLRDLPDLVVVFQGDGVKREALTRRARELGLDNVRFLPYLEKDQLRYAFASAHIQVVSLRRGLAGCIVPSKIYGVLASARPFVAAVDPDCEAALIARQWDAGLVVPPDDAHALAGAIRRLHESPALRDRLGANALAASHSYDRPVAVAAYHRLLTNLAGRAAPRV